MVETDKEKVKIEDLPVPLKDLNPDEQEDIKGGTGGVVNPTTNPTLNPTLNPTRPIGNPTLPRPSGDQY